MRKKRGCLKRVDERDAGCSSPKKMNVCRLKVDLSLFTTYIRDAFFECLGLFLFKGFLRTSVRWGETGAGATFGAQNQEKTIKWTGIQVPVAFG